MIEIDEDLCVVARGKPNICSLAVHERSENSGIPQGPIKRTSIIKSFPHAQFPYLTRPYIHTLSSEIKIAKNSISCGLSCHDNLSNPISRWYHEKLIPARKNMITKYYKLVLSTQRCSYSLIIKLTPFLIFLSAATRSLYQINCVELMCVEN